MAFSDGYPGEAATTGLGYGNSDRETQALDSSGPGACPVFAIYLIAGPGTNFPQAGQVARQWVRSQAPGGGVENEAKSCALELVRSRISAVASAIWDHSCPFEGRRSNILHAEIAMQDLRILSQFAGATFVDHVAIV